MSRIPIRLPSRAKYHAKRTDGYASKAEATRAAQLELYPCIATIRDLRKQPKYLLISKDEIGGEISYSVCGVHGPRCQLA
jgi:hypothetical protein